MNFPRRYAAIMSQTGYPMIRRSLRLSTIRRATSSAEPSLVRTTISGFSGASYGESMPVKFLTYLRRWRPQPLGCNRDRLLAATCVDHNTDQ